MDISEPKDETAQAAETRPSPDSGTPLRVLVADDDITSRTLLQMTLSRWEYAVECVGDGEEALARLAAPDGPLLAVVDWMMPKLDGVEVCRRLRALDRDRYTYVLLLTSKKSTEDIVAGLDAGADDFLTKPVDANELRSRLAVGVRTIRYEEALAEKTRQIEAYATRMEQLANERARQLMHAERLAMLGTLAAGVAHEINNPTGFIAGNTQLLERFWPLIETSLRASIAREEGEIQRLHFLLKEMPHTLSAIREGVERIAKTVASLKGFARRDEAQRESCHLHTCLEQALEICRNAIKYNVAVEFELADALPAVRGIPQQIEQVLINLLINASDAMEEQGGGTVRVRSRLADETLRIEVEDTGPGIPDDLLQEIWSPFFTTKARGKGTGLGLSISRHIMEEHGGSLEAENVDGGGARFVLTFPTRTEPPAALGD